MHDVQILFIALNNPAPKWCTNINQNGAGLFKALNKIMTSCI